MPDHPTQRTAAAILAGLEASARGRARTAGPLRLRGPGAAEEALLWTPTTVVFGWGLIAPT